ncbi:MAG TPA: dethiobiotin synthase [Steroidobacteraceae bacterium]|jgi:dethiobiotin synthetase|nr:dethiobiotin synthase [Steroidobacteraceae bacterium]
MTSGAGNQGFFISGTDTGVGKTLVTVALTRAFVARGLRAAVMKPVAAGAMPTPDGPRNDDALELLAAGNVEAGYDDVNPYLLTMAASPHLAARHDGVTIGAEKILAAHRRLAAISDVVLVEGAGGWLAPISSVATMADIAEKMALPVIVVVGLRLGCLNHALLTREAIRSSGLPFAGWIANKMREEMPLASANIETLADRFGVAPLAVVPAGSGAGKGFSGEKGTFLFSAAENRNVPFSRGAPLVPPWAIEVAEKLVSP